MANGNVLRVLRAAEAVRDDLAAERDSEVKMDEEVWTDSETR